MVLLQHTPTTSKSNPYLLPCSPLKPQHNLFEYSSGGNLLSCSVFTADLNPHLFMFSHCDWPVCKMTIVFVCVFCVYKVCCVGFYCRQITACVLRVGISLSLTHTQLYILIVDLYYKLQKIEILLSGTDSIEGSPTAAEIPVSVSCSRTLQHVERRSRGSDCKPSYETIHASSCAKVAPCD